VIAWLVACGPKIDVGPIPVETWAEPVPVVPSSEPDTDRIWLAALVRAGTGFDPIGREGLAWRVAHAVAGDVLDLRVDTRGIRLSLVCPRVEAPRCIERFAGALTDPALDAETWTALGERAMARATAVDALDVLEAVLFEGHRTGHPPPGHPGVLPTLTVDEGRAFHDAHYRRATMVAGVAGPDAAAWADKLRVALEAVPGGPPADDAWMRPPTLATRRLLVLEAASPDAAPVAFGQVLALPPDSPDLPALRRAVAALDGAVLRPDPGDVTALRGTVSLVGTASAGPDEPVADVLARTVAALEAWPDALDELPPAAPQGPLERLVAQLAAALTGPRPAAAPAPSADLVRRLVDPARWQLVVRGEAGDVSGFDEVVRVPPR